ncbi:hypothetical protein OUZ56_001614 [Daphnia magna]|uniref:Uncharacterized protein n=1 Tax=Daphnia magna TaxID=35525 RepID=A0ABR0A3Q9_9CRUS|nr:hypothetical protein OUZ56_001614 [Daphnia magna]
MISCLGVSHNTPNDITVSFFPFAGNHREENDHSTTKYVYERVRRIVILIPISDMGEQHQLRLRLNRFLNASSIIELSLYRSFREKLPARLFIPHDFYMAAACVVGGTGV